MRDIVTQEQFQEVRFFRLGSEWEAFQEFPMDIMQEDDETFYDLKAQQMVYMLNQAYQFTKKELVNFLTVKEAQFIVGAFVNTLYDPSLPCKKMLITNIEDTSRFEGLDEMFDVDVNEFINKLHQLTEFQAFTVIRMAYEYLRTPDRINMEVQSRGKELVATVFGIEEDA